MKKVLTLLFVLCLGLAGQGLMAQGSTTASMRGEVKTATGESLPGATVLAVHEPTGSQYGAVTNAQGIYNLRNMNVGGPYKVTVSFVGYQPFEKTGIYLQLGQTFSLNVPLSEDSQELETITINARRDDVFDGNRTGAQTNIGNEIIMSAPNASRDLSDFLRLSPQAFVDDSDDDGAAVSIAGQNNRFNSIFIDGAVNNDVFGLSAQGTNGGQTGVSPISIDAIEQFEILIAPYDVTKAGFTGGGINAVTRSGTNDFKGSAYYFVRNENLSGKTPTGISTENREKLPEFSAEQYGFRLGGPVIKNKLFFFVNAEIQREETPQPFDISNFNGNAADVAAIQNYVRTNFNYETGDFTNNASSLASEKILVKLDWNISQNHKLSIRHSYVNAENIDGFASRPDRINFANNSEVFPSTTNSTALELKSTFGNNFANNLIIGYTRVKDDRGFAGNPFPSVNIEDNVNNVNFFLGSEAFSTANLLEQDVFTITNNFNWFKGNHTITIGTHNEFYSLNNIFIPQNFGAYTYLSVNDFLTGAEPDFFVRSFSLVDGTTERIGDATGAAAAFNAYQLGFYIQDEFQVSDRLKLTGGLRFDIPQMTTTPGFAADVFTTTIPAIEQYHDLRGARPGQVPDAQVYFSPRFGFNWDVFGDQKTQVRGGLGVFTGRVPFVWPGGMFNNTGINVGQIRGTTLADGTTPVPLRSPDNAITAADLGATVPVPSGSLQIFENDYRYPQVFRTSLAIDQQLPWGLVGTIEGIYTKNINAIDHRNVNFLPATMSLNGAGGLDTRPIRPLSGPEIDPRYTDIIVVGNTNQGHTWNFTAQLQKPFDNGLTASVSYSFGSAFSVNDGLSSQLTSNWGRVQHVNGLDRLDASRSNFDLAHRVNAFVSYRKEYAKNFATTVSLFYNGQSGRPFSYVINNRRTFDPGSRNNSLFFVPRTMEEANLVDILDGGGAVEVSAEQQWFALNQFIESDPYLRSRRGQYTERNGGRAPFEHILDFRIMQDFKIDAGGRNHILQLSLDIFNFTNFLNKDWGRRYNIGDRNTINGVNMVNLANASDLASGATNVPQYTYTGATDIQDVFDDNIQDFARINRSRWMMQFGVRYIFD